MKRSTKRLTREQRLKQLSNRRYQQKHRTELREKRRAREARHREERNAYWRRWTAKNHAHYTAWRRRWKKKNLEKVRAANWRWWKNLAPERKALRQAKKSASRRQVRARRKSKATRGNE